MRLAPLLLVAPLALCGCTATGTIASQVPNITSQIDQTIDAVILQKLQDAHNLAVAIEQINSTPGMVTVVMPAPVVAQPSPASMTPVAAPPTTTTTPSIMSPSPVPAPTPMPTVP